MQREFKMPLIFPERTDIAVRARAVQTAGITVSASFEGWYET
jgi:hypothetical protein